MSLILDSLALTVCLSGTCAAGTREPSRDRTCICPMHVGEHAFGNMPAAPKIQASDARATRIIIKRSNAVKVVAAL